MSANPGSNRIEDEKRGAAEAAVDRVEDGMTVGLGTGTTAAYAIRAIGDLVADGWSIRGVPTSYQAGDLARSVGIEVVSLDDVPVPALAIDGADQVARGCLLKGGGGAHTREKIVATAAEDFLVVVDSRKPNEILDEPVPLEVMPMARAPVRRAVETLGGSGTLRAASEKAGPVVTDNGNLILDCDFGRIEDPHRLASDLGSIPGVVEHGLFVEIPHTIFVGTVEGVRTETVGHQ